MDFRSEVCTFARPAVSIEILLLYSFASHQENLNLIQWIELLLTEQLLQSNFKFNFYYIAVWT